MAGKNRANTLSAILSNMEDLEGAYNDALNAEGSALKENEAYLDSIQGRIDLFNNSVQTMWMNFIDSDVVKFIIDLGTGLIKAADSIGILKIAFAGLLSYMNLSSKFDFDLASMLGIHKKSDKFLEGFDIFGKEGLTGKFANIGQGIDQLINKIKNLKASRDEIVSSSVQSVAATVSSTVNQDVQKYQSMLSVLSQIQNVELSIGSEADAAKKIDLMSQAAENGQASLANYVTGLGDADVALKAYAASVQDGNYSLAGFQQFITQHNASVKASGIAARAAAIGHQLLNAALSMGISLLVSFAIDALVKGFDAFRESAEEISEAYEEAINTIKETEQSFRSLKSSASDVIPRFAELAKGVDKFGNNISLTEEEYEEFLSLNNKIAEMFPEINAGMDSNGNAMLSMSYTSDTLTDSLWDLVEAERALADIKIAESMPDVVKGIKQDVGSFKDEIDSLQDTIGAIKGIKNLYENEAIKEMFTNNGVFNESAWLLYINNEVLDMTTKAAAAFNNPKLWQNLVNKYTVDGVVDWYALINSDEMANALAGVEIQLNNFNTRIEKKWNELKPVVNAWLNTNYVYDSMNSDLQAAVNSIVSSLDFSSLAEQGIDKSDEIQAYIQTNILDVIDQMTPEAQQKLIDLFTINPASMNWETYISVLNSSIEAFWQSIGGENNVLGFAGKEDLALTFGFDIQTIDEQEDIMIDRFMEITGQTEDEAIKFFESLPATTVQRLLTVDWTTVTSENLGSILNPATEAPTVQTYSSLSSSSEGLSDVLQQTSEILHNGIEVTQEYKDTLIELGVSLEDLNACFDENNPLVVTNSFALQQLVEDVEANTAANVKLAKSQARLKYIRLVKELNQICSSTETLTNEQLIAASAILSQIDAVETAIYKYTLLEDSLLGVHNAFDRFTEGKDIDAMNTYGQTYVDMVQTIYDAYTKTGEVGSEAVNAAVEALIDPSVLSGLQKGSDAYNHAVYDYLVNNLIPTLTLDEDSLSLDFAAIERFVTDGLGKIFTGTGIEDFDLVEGMKLEKAAELMSMTETQAYAMFAALKQYTGVDFLSMLDDSLEGRIMRVNEDLLELNERKIALLQDGGYTDHAAELEEINRKIQELTGSLDTLKKDAFEDLTQYEFNAGLMSQLSELGDMSVTTGKKLEGIKSGFTDQYGDDGLADFRATMGVTLDQASADEVFDYLLAKQAELGEPTVVTVEYAIEENENMIADLEAELAKIADQKTFMASTGQFDVVAELTLKEEDLKKQIDALQLQNEEWKVTYGIENEDTVMQSLQSIDEFTIAGKTFTVTAHDNASGKLQNVLALIRQIRDTALTLGLTVSGSAGLNGTAHLLGTALKNGSWGAERTETALVGELGPELLVRGNRWKTIGDNGAEFAQIRKGDIIFNHRQTEDLLSKGYISGRGRMVGGAFASGTAYASLWPPKDYQSGNGSSTSGSLSGDEEDEFEEIFDWFEVLLEEINEQLDLMSAKLENAVGISAKGSLIDELLNGNHYKIYELGEGIKLYTDYAAKLLKEVPEEYREMAQDGAVHITEFLGEANEETVEAINNYREWAQKVADLNQQLEETKTEIADLAKQKFDIIADEYDNILGILEAQRDQFDAQISLMEDRGYVASKTYYESMIQNTREQSKELEKQKKAMQEVLNEQVRLGNIKVGSEQWYEMVEALYDVDSSIKDCVADLEDYQNSINDIYWDNFDNLIMRLDYLKDETENLIDLMGNEDLVITPELDEGWSADQVEWSKEGLASMGLYAQQMEIAEYTARQYAEAIDDLNNDFKAGKYSESEYQEKLEDLTSSQYDAIQSYHDAQKAITDLHKARVDAIKEGIDKEIAAYEKLIQKKREELSADKDLYDFEKSVADQQKNISDIERKIAALSADESLSAIAKRKQLEAELAEARASLEESYHDRSVTDQQNALDKELENYKEEKDEEIKKLEEYLEDVETVVFDSLGIIKDNASGIYDTLNEKASEYNLNLSNSIVSPWKDGELAVSEYQTAFDTAMSSTTNQLDAMKKKWQELIDKMTKAAQVEISSQQKENNEYVEATPVPTVSTTSTSKAITVGGKINAGSALIYADSNGGGAATQYYSSDPIYTVLQEKNGYVLVRHHSLSSGNSGWFKKTDVRGYAKGTTGTKKDEIAWIDELGDELVMHADGSGRLSFLTKGTSVIPHDISENLMELGQLDPTDVLNRNKPVISMSTSVVTNNMEIAEVVHIDTVSNETIPDLTKAIEKQMDKYMKNINNNIRKYAR